MVGEFWGEYRLTHSEVMQLELLGLRGSLAFNRGGVQGALVGVSPAKEARVVVIASRPITRRIQLAQPDGVNVIYYQDGKRWRMIPSNSPTIKRKIILEPAKTSKRNTEYLVENADGSSQGGTAFTW